MLRPLLPAVAVLLLAGCGPKGPNAVPFKGKVVFDKDGDIKALAGYTIEMTATDGNKAYGEIKDDGTFTVYTTSAGVAKEGAVEGPQAVRFISPNVDDAGKPIKPPINKKYFDSETSNLNCTITKGAEVIIKVTR